MNKNILNGNAIANKEYFNNIIEEKCRPLVLLFNSIGFKTEFCCQGHNDGNVFYISFKEGVSDININKFKNILLENNINLNGSIQIVNRGIAGWEYFINKPTLEENWKSAEEDFNKIKFIAEKNDLYFDSNYNIKMELSEHINDICCGFFNSIFYNNVYISNFELYRKILDDHNSKDNDIRYAYSILKNDTFDLKEENNTYNSTSGYINVNSDDEISIIEKINNNYVLYPEMENIYINQEDKEKNTTTVIYMGIKSLARVILDIACFIQYDEDDLDSFINNDEFNSYFKNIVDIDGSMSNCYCENCMEKIKINFIKCCKKYYFDLKNYLMYLISSIEEPEYDDITGEVSYPNHYIKIILNPTSKYNKINCSDSECYNNIEFNLDSCCNDENFKYDKNIKDFISDNFDVSELRKVMLNEKTE